MTRTELALAATAWQRHGQVNDWHLPTPAARIWRLPGVRAIRVLWVAWRIVKYESYPYCLPTPNCNAWLLYAIYRGWA